MCNIPNSLPLKLTSKIAVFLAIICFRVWHLSKSFQIQIFITGDSSSSLVCTFFVCRSISRATWRRTDMFLPADSFDARAMLFSSPGGWQHPGGFGILLQPAGRNSSKPEGLVACVSSEALIAIILHISASLGVRFACGSCGRILRKCCSRGHGASVAMLSLNRGGWFFHTKTQADAANDASAAVNVLHSRWSHGKLLESEYLKPDGEKSSKVFEAMCSPSFCCHETMFTQTQMVHNYSWVLVNPNYPYHI